MTIKIPGDTKTWSQLNKGDLLGTLHSTRNIDLNSSGVLTLAQRTKAIVTGQTNPFLGVGAIVNGNFESVSSYAPAYWIVSNQMFTLSYDLTSFAVDAKANTPSIGYYSDACKWNGNLYVTKSVRIAKLSAGTWTTNWSSADFANSSSSDFPYHPIEPNVTNQNLLVGDGNLLKKVIADGTITTALTLPADYNIRWIRRGAGVNFIGLQPVNGATGAVAVWDGLDTTIEANQLIPLTCKIAFSGCLDENGIFMIIQSDGRLRKYNGNGFLDEAELPPFRDYLLRYNFGNTFNLAQAVHHRGMCLVRGKIHVVIDAYNDRVPQLVSNFQSGVWVYDADNKAFYHRGSPSNSSTVTEFGQTAGTSLVSAISPVYEGNSQAYPVSSVGGTFLAGARCNLNDYSGENRVMYTMVTGENRGQFTTSRIESQGITDNAIKLWCKFKGVLTATDKIIFKYKDREFTPLFTVNDVSTWTSTTTFTSTDTNWANAVVGYEIQLTEGNGAGGTAHITEISYSNPTYTITIDEAITGVAIGNKGRMLVDSFKKLGTQITYADTLGYKLISLPITNKTWFQLKGELRGEGRVVTIQELQIVNDTHLPAQ